VNGARVRVLVGVVLVIGLAGCAGAASGGGLAVASAPSSTPMLDLQAQLLDLTGVRDVSFQTDRVVLTVAPDQTARWSTIAGSTPGYLPADGGSGALALIAPLGLPLWFSTTSSTGTTVLVRVDGWNNDRLLTQAAHLLETPGVRRARIDGVRDQVTARTAADLPAVARVVSRLALPVQRVSTADGHASLVTAAPGAARVDAPTAWQAAGPGRSPTRSAG
jgi:hypothetical protein